MKNSTTQLYKQNQTLNVKKILNQFECMLSMSIVEALESIKKPDIHHIYLLRIPAEEYGDLDRYDEYLYINGKFEKIGCADPNLTEEEVKDMEDKLKEAISHHCPNCGASITYGQQRCSYCNSIINWQ